MAKSNTTKVVRPGGWDRVEGVLVWVEGSSGELCGLDEPITIHRTATQFSCEHGTWDFTDPGAPKTDPATS